ncbi:ABC transporter permease [Nocardioides sp.]|uniref:ABC transporter permease n=1 Tax=Nocardioides sp. TaxID=35761 RepID=UPI003D0DFF35
MSVVVTLIILGLALGAVFAVFANCLVAVYRATGIINFAQGAMAMWGAYVMSQLNKDGVLVLPIGRITLSEEPLGLWPSAIIGLVCGVVLTLLCHFLVFRPLRKAPALSQVVASVGLLLFLQSLVSIRFGNFNVRMAPLVPNESFTLGSVQVSRVSLVSVIVAFVVCLLLWSYFRFTRWGIATRAGSEGEFGLRLMGYSPDRLSAIVWGFTGFFSTAIVMVAGSLVGLDTTIYTFAVISALAVALVGLLKSFWGAFVAGVALGGFQAWMTYESAQPWWPSWAKVGLTDAVPFLVIILVLVLFGHGIPARGRIAEPRLPAVTIPRIRPVLATLCTLVTVLALVMTSGNYRYAIFSSIILTILFLSFTVLTGYLGQISLAQMAFAGTAGFALSKIQENVGIPFPVSVVMATAIATVMGVVIGAPALRIRGAQLAVITLAAAIVVQKFIFQNNVFTPLTGNPLDEPTLFGINLAVREGTNVARLQFGLFCLAVLIVVMIVLALLLGGRTGQAFLAVRANERAAASIGIDVSRTKLLGFAISSAVAGLAGCLISYSQGQVVAAAFLVIVGLSMLATVYLGGIGSFAGAVVAGIIGPAGIVYLFLNQTVDLGVYYPLIAALLLIVTAIFNPIGIAGGTRVLWDLVMSRQRGGRPTQTDTTGNGQSPVRTESAHAEVS